MSELAPLPSSILPSGVRSRFVEDVNGLRVHILEAGFEAVGRPLVLLLHGFPELAYSWRKVMRPLAAAGLHIVAPISAATGGPPGGMPATTATSPPSARSTWCGMPWR